VRRAKRQGSRAPRSIPLWAALVGPPVLLAALIAIALASLEAAEIVALVALVIGYAVVMGLMWRGYREKTEYYQSKAYRDRVAALPDDSFPAYLARAADRGRIAVERRAARKRRAEL
jgi:hypothetical protein